MSVTLGEALRRSAEFLAARGCPSARTDAEHLLAHALRLSRIELYTQHDRPLEPPELDAARALLRRRGEREPLQHILGEWGFRRLTLTTDRRALIPRPETETVVERALALLSGKEAPRVLDLGVGSGAIALAIADEHPGAIVTGIDVSDDALALAAHNSERTGHAIALKRGDVLEEALPAGPWDLVVSNPPYVEHAERDGLDPEVRDHDPALALFGTGFHEAIAGKAHDVLVAGGALVLECGSDQGRAVCELLQRHGYRDVRLTQDMAHRDRVVEGLR